MPTSHVLCTEPWPPYRPKQSLLDALYRLGKGRLRLRWSNRQDKWCLEIKMGRAQFINQLQHYVPKRVGSSAVMVENDSWIRARDGYELIGFYAAQPPLDDWVIRNLEVNDTRNYHNVAEIERTMDSREEKAAASRKQASDDEYRAKAEDWYDHWSWRSGERAVVPTNFTRE